ncbi:ISL3 family transposase [Streptomyces sp. ID05-47C]|nr:ISL3 family transposase [Streptomyces sp. ID05-47C]
MNDEAVRIEARSTVVGSDCPGCGSWSRCVHSSYLRFPADVPSGGRRVILCLCVRRFLCTVTSCGRRTFAEQMTGLTRRYGRRTECLRSTLAAVGLALAGRAGARTARVFGVSVSRSTVMRLVEALPDPEFPAPRVVGVDEYATRKGRHYGTVLVDVERRRPVDLLPEREASSLAAWLAKRPGIEVVRRDRAPFFAEGAPAGAPQAVQVADRWHLWHNLSGSRRALCRRPSRMPPGPGVRSSPACLRAGDNRRPVWLALAKGTSLRRPNPSQPCDRPRTADRRTQSEGDRPPAPHDLAHRQTLRRRSHLGGPVPRAVAGPAVQAGRVQALPG